MISWQITKKQSGGQRHSVLRDLASRASRKISKTTIKSFPSERCGEVLFFLLCAEFRVIYKVESNSDKKGCGLMNIDVVLILIFVQVIMGERTDKVLALQFSALRELQVILHYYEQRGYSAELIGAIAEKKGQMIITTTTKAEMEKVLHPPAPYYNASVFVADKYLIPEEELICWSETSLRGPLIKPALKRYLELFQQFYPDEAKTSYEEC